MQKSIRLETNNKDCTNGGHRPCSLHAFRATRGFVGSFCRLLTPFQVFLESVYQNRCRDKDDEKQDQTRKGERAV